MKTKNATNIQFNIEQYDKELQIAENDIRTNTTKIFVCSDKLDNNEEILLYLYDADFTETPISYAVLNSENNLVEFSNLTSICKYKIGTESRNISRAITLTITDNGN